MYGLRLDRGESAPYLVRPESKLSVANVSESEEEELSEADSEEDYEPRFTRSIFSDYIVFLPFNPVWKFLLMVLISSLYCITIYELVFLHSSSFNRHLWMKIMKYACHVAYLIDTIAAIVHRKNKSVAALKNHRPRPLWQIAIDGFTLLPFQLIVDFTNSQSSSSTQEIFTLMLLVGCIRVYRIYLYFGELTQSVGLNPWANVLTNFGTLMFLITHTLTCLYFWLTEVKHGFWGGVVGLTPDSNPTDWYVIGLYYINTVFTATGFGDLYSVTWVEHLISLLTMISGFVFLTGIFSGALTDVLVQSYRGHSIFWNKLHLIKLDLTTCHEPFSNVMINRVMSFYKRFWVEKGSIKESFILTTLPNQMRGEVYVDIYWNAINACRIFRDLDISYKRELAKYMHSECYLEGDIILNQGALKCKMLYVVQGVIQILSKEDSESPLISMTTGTCLGEVSLLLSYPSVVEITAATYCELQMLDKKQLMHLIRAHPQIGRKIYQTHSALVAEAMNSIRDKNFDEVDQDRPVTSSGPTTVPRRRALKELKMSLRHRDDIENRTEPFSWMTETEKEELLTEEEKLALLPVYKVLSDVIMAQYCLSKSMKLETDDVCLRTHWPWVFNPNCNIISIWNWIIVITVSIACVLVPYYVCFEMKQIVTVTTLFTIIDVFYWLDIYIQLTTALSVNGVYVVSIFQIVLLKSQKLTYIIDILAALPLEQAAKSIFVFDNDLKYNVFRLNRVFKVHRVLMMFQQLENGPLWDNTFVRISKYTVFLLLGSFWMGTGFFMLACIDDESCPNSWVSELGSKNNMALKSFYCAIVIISQTGFGDILPVNSKEMIFMVGFYVVGCMLFTYLIADFSGMLILKAMPRNDFTQRVFAISRFMEVSIVDSSIRDRVNNFLLLQWHYRRGYFIMKNQLLYSDTPEIMQNWIRIWRRKNFFLGMDLFKGSDIKLIEKLCLVAESYALPPDEVVTFAGEVCREFYIVEEGFCESTSSLVKDVGIFGPYTSFNESEMVFGIPGFHHVRTLTHCKLLRITHRNFKLILAQFPEFKETLLKVQQEQVLDERTVPSVRSLRVVPHSEKKPSKEVSWIVHRASTKQHPNADYDKPFKRLHIYAFIRHFLMRRTIHPGGRFLIGWEVSRSIFALMSALLFPPLAEFRTVYPSLRYIAIVLDVAAYVDLYVRMHVCYYNKKGLLISHPWYTCKHYFSQGFALDLIACFPFEVFFGSDGSNIRESSHIVGQNFLRLNRAMQLYRIESLASYCQYDIIKQYTYVPLLRFLPSVLALVNILTCVYIWIHSEYSKDLSEKPFKPKPGTMLNKFKDGGDHFSFTLEHPVDYYILSCYWVSGIMFSVGFGDIVPMNESEEFFAIVCILVGYLVLTYVTVCVASSYAIYNRNLTLYQENMRHLINFTKREKITRFLRREIVEHFENVWQKTLGLRPYQMFEKFHVQLKEDAAMHLYEHTLTVNPLFKDVEKSFFRRLVVLVRERYFVPGAEVITLHDFVTEVLFVHYGELNVFDLTGEKRAVLRKGNVFGNLERHNGIRLTMPIVASTNVLVLAIRSETFFRLVDDYPIIMERFQGKDSEELMFESYEAELQSKLGHTSTSASNIISFESTFLRNVAKLSSVANVILMIFSYLSCGFIAFHLAFQSENPSLVVIVCSFSLDLCILSRFFFGFFAPTKNKMGDTIKEPHLIRANYMKDKFGFWMDVVACFPLELFAFAAPEKDWWYTVACLRLLHLVRIGHVVKFFNISFEKLDINILLYKASHLGLWVILLGHVSTCIYYMIGCPRQNCIPGSWADKYYDICYEDFYICSLYLIVEVFTTAGVGNIAARTQSEMVYIIVLTVLDRFAIGIFIGGMSAIVANYSYTLVNYDFETNILKYYLRNNPVCGPLVNMVLKYVQMMWKGENGQQIPAFLESTPSYLLARFNTEVYGKHLYENFIFSACDSDFLRQLIVYLKRFTFFPGNFIAQQGDMDNSLYFVHEGEVEVVMVSGSSMELIDVLSPGDTFGLRQGLHMNKAHDYTYRASAVTVVLTLDYKRWEHLLEYFPGTRSDILSRVDAVVAAIVTPHTE